MTTNSVIIRTDTICPEDIYLLLQSDHVSSPILDTFDNTERSDQREAIVTAKCY